MKVGDIILTSLPQADGQKKLRPALVLKEMPKFRDLLICGISTNIANCINGFDEIVSPNAGDYKTSGLLQESLIRLGFLTVLPAKDIHGSIGRISDERYARLLKNLINYLREK